MTVKISQTADVQRFFEEASGQLNERGDPRTRPWCGASSTTRRS